MISDMFCKNNYQKYMLYNTVDMLHVMLSFISLLANTGKSQQTQIVRKTGLKRSQRPVLILLPGLNLLHSRVKLTALET